jgi:hypothetical protein
MSFIRVIHNGEMPTRGISQKIIIRTENTTPLKYIEQKHNIGRHKTVGESRYDFPFLIVNKKKKISCFANIKHFKINMLTVILYNEHTRS